MTKIHRHIPFEERFWLQVRKSASCREWIGAKNEGYGLITHNGRDRRATHAAWFIAHGVWPSGGMLCHTCDNPSCVRVDHLFIGSAADNTRDAMKKGRMNGWPTRDKRGEKNGRAKLSASDVAYIMKASASASSLSAKYGVATSTIYRIKRGEWGKAEGMTP